MHQLRWRISGRECHRRRGPREIGVGPNRAEVDQHDVSVGCQQSVLRLHVAVHEPRLVHGVERVEQLERHPFDPRPVGARPAVGPCVAAAERRRRDFVHRVVGGPALLPDVEDAHDVGVPDPIEHSRFAQEAVDHLPVGRPEAVVRHHLAAARVPIRGAIEGQLLDDDQPVEPSVARTVRDAEAAGAENGLDGVTMAALRGGAEARSDL